MGNNEIQQAAQQELIRRGAAEELGRRQQAPQMPNIPAPQFQQQIPASTTQVPIQPVPQVPIERPGISAQPNEGVPWATSAGIAGLSTIEHMTNLVKRAMDMGLATTNLGPDPITEESHLFETLGQALRPSQSLGQNVASGAIGLAPYLNPAGPFIFAGELASQPEAIPEMAKGMLEHGRNINKALFGGTGVGDIVENIFRPGQKGDPEAIEAIRQAPIEHAMSLAIGLGAAKGGLKAGKAGAKAAGRQIRRLERFTAGAEPGPVVSRKPGKVIDKPVSVPQVSDKPLVTVPLPKKAEPVISKLKAKEPWEMTREHSFKTEEGKFSEHSIIAETQKPIHPGPKTKQRAGVVTVHEGKEGFTIRNILLSDDIQRRGIGTGIYDKINAESLAKTGKPLMSSKPRIIDATGKTVHELNQSSRSLWEKLVDEGKAKKTGGDSYQYLTPEKPPVPKTEPVGPDTKLPSVSVQKKVSQLKVKPVPFKEKPVVKEPLIKEAGKPLVTKPVRPAEPLPEKFVGLNKAEIAFARQSMGRTELTPDKVQTFKEAFSEAKRTGADIRASDIANDILKTKRQAKTVEQAGMVLEVGRLDNAYEASVKTANDLINKGNTKGAALERKRGDAIQEQIDRIERASKLAGRETGRALSIRRALLDREDFSLSVVTQKAQVSKGSKLTTKEKKKIEKVVAEVERLEAKVKELEAKDAKTLEAAEKVQAGQIARKVKISKKTRTVKKQLFDERVNIKKEIAKLGFRVNDITGVTAEGAYLIGKLATNYIKAGTTNLQEIVKLVRQDVPDITTRDVYQALISKDPARQFKAKSRANKQVALLKRQAKLLLDLENAEKGIFDPVKKKAAAPLEIRTLQKKLREMRRMAYRTTASSERLERALQTINELEDQLANHYRTIKKGKPAETETLTALKEKARDLRRELKVEDELASLNEQLETGDFIIKEKPIARKLPQDLDRKLVELSIARKNVRGAIADAAPVTVGKIAGEAVNSARTMETMGEMSGTLRQGLILVLQSPKAVPKNFAEAFKGTFSQMKAEQYDQAWRRMPGHYIREKAGLDWLEIGGHTTRREELFAGRFLEKIPGLGQIIKASQRNMTLFLNGMRGSSFDAYLERYPNATTHELSRWANFVNISSGRGNLGGMERYAGKLSWPFYAPRYAISRLQYPFMGFREIRTPRVRKEIAKSYVRVASMGAITLGLAELAGWDVGTDPRNSDWGKIKVGNTRIDIFAGIQQPMRVVFRIGAAVTDKLGITGKDLSKSEKELDVLSFVGRSISYKLGPPVTIPLEIYRGKSIVGEPAGIKETSLRAFTPFMVQDIRDAWKLEGPEQAAGVGVLTFFGVGANTYTKGLKKSKKKFQ